MGRLITTYSTYEASVAVAAVAAGTPICQIAPPQVATNGDVVMGLTHLRVVLTTAVQGLFGLVAAATAGTPTAPGTLVGLLASFGNNGFFPTGGAGRLLSLWSAAPTIAGTPLYYEMDLLPNTIGAGFEWTWPDDDPLTHNLRRTVSPNFQDTGLILQNLNGGASPDVVVSARWTEFSPNV